MTCQPSSTAGGSRPRWRGPIGAVDGALLQVLLEPSQRALHCIFAVRRIAQTVTFAGVDHDGGRYVQGFQRVPKLLRLRSRTLDVAFSHVLEGRRLDIADEIDRR